MTQMLCALALLQAGLGKTVQSLMLIQAHRPPVEWADKARTFTIDYNARDEDIQCRKVSAKADKRLLASVAVAYELKIVSHRALSCSHR